MKKEILEDSKNYTCQVVRIKEVSKLHNADKLGHTFIQGNSIICGIDTKIGDLYLYFPLESQLGEEFATANDLIRRKDANGKAAGGMFELNRRVRCLKLRGSRSEGCIIPLQALDKIGVDSKKLNEGDEFNVLEDKLICKKYIIHTTEERKPRNRTNSIKKHESKLIEGQFRLHTDTEQFKRFADYFRSNDVVAITQKLHGTSVVLANILCKKKLNIFQKIIKKIGVDIVDTEYSHIYSSRKVIKNEDLNAGTHYYTQDIWTLVSEKYRDRIPEGITLYGEVVGQLPNGQWIQNGYSYGTEEKNWGLYIYRITYTSYTGRSQEYSWQQIKNFCKVYNFNHVPELYYGTLGCKFNFSTPDELIKLLDGEYLNKTLPENVPDEGICIRNESTNFEAYKFKSFNFLEAETKALDKGEVSVEDVS
jgi:hypothetical protein